MRKLSTRLAAVGAVLGLSVFAMGGTAVAAVAATVTPNTNLTDGQTVHVHATGLPASLSAASVAECVRGATSSSQCEGATNDVSHGTDASGTYDNTGYIVNVLPNNNFPFTSINCDGSGANECDLFVGQDLNNFNQPHTLVPIEFASPGQGVPEVPYAVLLPLSALLVISAGYVLHRRRSNRSMPAA